jgi:hypothetical protein
MHGLDSVQVLGISRQKVVLVVVVNIMIIRIRRKRRDHLKNTPGKQDIKGLQKITILGTAHILAKVQM